MTKVTERSVLCICVNRTSHNTPSPALRLFRARAQGLPEDRGAGVGLSLMRERAVELGGTCRVEQSLSAGTRLVARLPLHENESAERTTEQGGAIIRVATNGSPDAIFQTCVSARETSLVPLNVLFTKRLALAQHELAERWTRPKSEAHGQQCQMPTVRNYRLPR